MKNRIVLSLIAVALTFSASAQQTLKSNTSGGVLDTVTNTGVRIMKLKVPGYQETITATILITKISGTQGGTMVPVGSDDGVNWNDISMATKDTLTVPNNATVVKGYFFQKGWSYYGVQWTGTGSMSGSISGTLVARKTTQ